MLDTTRARAATISAVVTTEVMRVSLRSSQPVALVTGNKPTNLAVARDRLPSDAVVLQADSSKIDSADTVAGELRTRFGRVDAVVLNAGIGRMVPIEAVDEAMYDEHFAVNVKNQFFTLQKALPLIEPGGSIIFTSSVGSYLRAPNWSVYTATKGALRSTVRALAGTGRVLPSTTDNGHAVTTEVAVVGAGPAGHGHGGQPARSGFAPVADPATGAPSGSRLPVNAARSAYRTHSPS